MIDGSPRSASRFHRVPRVREKWSGRQTAEHPPPRFARMPRPAFGEAWTWLVVVILVGAWVVVMAALASLAPTCRPGSPVGPTIGGVVKIAGC